MSVSPHSVLGHPDPWTVADVETLPDSGDHARYELLSVGVLTVSPAPSTLHQRASRHLANLLEAAARRAGADVEVLEAVNVDVLGGRLTTPDVVIVDGRAADRDPLRYLPTDVLLVVEVVSPGSRATDRAIKPELYAEAGIAYYWRLELQPDPELHVATLHDGRYVPAPVLRAGRAGQVSEPFAVTLDPAQLITREKGRIPPSER